MEPLTQSLSVASAGMSEALWWALTFIDYKKFIELPLYSVINIAPPTVTTVPTTFAWHLTFFMSSLSVLIFEQIMLVNELKAHTRSHSGKIQVAASPLIRLTNKPNATIEEIGGPEKLIASLGQLHSLVLVIAAHFSWKINQGSCPRLSFIDYHRLSCPLTKLGLKLTCNL